MKKNLFLLFVFVLFSQKLLASSLTPQGSTDLCITHPSVNLIVSPANALNYDWCFIDVYGHLNHLISVTGNTYTAWNTGFYYCVVTETGGVVTTTNSIMVRQAWNGQSVWSYQNFDLTCGQNLLQVYFYWPITFDTYQWTRNGQIIPGATSSSYSATTGGFYNCWIGNSCGADTNSYGLNVPYVLQTLPASIPLTASAGDTVCLSSQYKLSVPYYFGAKYTWRKILSNGSNIAITLNSADTSLTRIGYSAGYDVYRCDLQNGCSARNTINDTIWSTGNLTSVTIQPVTNSFCVGDSVTLNAYSPNGDVNYQWKESGIDIPGKTAKELTVSAGGNYSVFVTNGISCSATSTSQLITRYSNPASTITSQGATTFCNGDSVVLTGNYGNTLSYQWTKNNITIPGANVLNYTAKSAGNYRLQVTNSHGCSRISSVKKITVNSLPTASISALGSTSFCQGGSVMLQGPSTSGLAYQWKKNGVLLSGGNNSQYLASLAGNYRCLVTNTNGCSKLSNSISVTVPCRNNDKYGDLGNIYAYPNPSSSGFKISLENISSNDVTAQLFDITGRIVNFDLHIDDNGNIEIEKLPAGMYQLLLNYGDKSSAISLVALD